MEVEFANEDEVVAYLVYEKLEKHCYVCVKLDHEEKDCPLAKKQAAETKSREEAYKEKGTRERQTESSTYRSTSRSGYQREVNPYKYKTFREPYVRGQSVNSEYQSRSRDYHTTRTPTYGHKEYAARHRTYDEGRRSVSSKLDYSQNTLGHRKSFLPPPAVWKEKIPSKDELRPVLRDEASDSSRQRRSPVERTETAKTPPIALPKEAMDVALGELRDVMIQYSSCPDPTESAARKVRMMQAETSGEMEDAAAQMVKAAMKVKQQQMIPVIIHEDQTIPEEELAPPEVISDTFRMGPSGDKSDTSKAGQKRQSLRRSTVRRIIQISPKLRAVANSRKRRLVSEHASPIRRFKLDAEQNIDKNVKTKDKASTSRQIIPRSEENCAHRPPPLKLIPSSKSKKAGFQKPPSPLP